jgi:tetratricopeptide (TPR) repeat protein
MAKPKNIALTEEGVITQEALAAYIEGRLNDAEHAEMDKLLAADPFAQEALDGLRKATKLNDMPTAITSINTLLREKTGLRERRKKGIEIHWTVYAYASVILAVLIGAGFVMIHFMPGNNRQPEEKVIPQGQESMPVIEKTDTIAKDTIQPVRSDETATPVDTTAATDSSKIPKIPATPVAAGQAVATASPKAKDSIGPEMAVQLEIAKAYFDASDYINAYIKYNEVLASQPGNADALFFGGISCYLSETPGLGEANFDKLLRAGAYPDGAKWYKANILIRRGQKEAAKQMLRDLVNSNSTYKERAIKKYEELYK